MGFEPTTPTLARLCSTPELHPHSRTGSGCPHEGDTYGPVHPHLQLRRRLFSQRGSAQFQLCPLTIRLQRPSKVAVLAYGWLG
jgi:hypothetical protein